MKKLIVTVLLLICGYCATAQIYGRPSTSYGTISYRGAFDSALLMPTFNAPPTGIGSLHSNNSVRKAAFYYDSTTSKLYLFNPKDSSWKWILDSVTVSTNSINNQYGLTLAAQSAKFWVTDTIKTSENISAATANIPLITATTIGGTLSTAAQPNITSVGTLTALTVTNQVTANRFNGSGAGLTNIPNSALTNSSITIGSTNIPLGSTATTITGLASLTSTSITGTLQTASQPNITLLGTLTALTVSGTATAATFSATNNVFANNIVYNSGDQNISGTKTFLGNTYNFGSYNMRRTSTFASQTLFSWENASQLSRWTHGIVYAEGGSNTGYDLFLSRYNDAGSFVANFYTMFRGTGNLVLNSSTDDGVHKLQVVGGSIYATGLDILTNNNLRYHSVSGATTGYYYATGQNTGGGYYFGGEGSVAGTFGANTSAYSTLLMTQATTDLDLGTNNQVNLKIRYGVGIRFVGYGAGTLTTDASGNITATSDRRKKDSVGLFKRGLNDILKLRNKAALYHWSKQSGLSTTELNAGYFAQDVKKAIPEAVFYDNKKDNYTMIDRPLTATAINAIIELNDKLNKKIASLEARLKKIEKLLKK